MGDKQRETADGREITDEEVERYRSLKRSVGELMRARDEDDE